MKSLQLSAIFAVMAILSGFGAPVFGDDAKDETEATFRRLDKNGDGKVSASEIPEDQSRFFERLLRKVNKPADGELTLEEFRRANQPEERPNVAPGGDAEQARRDSRQRFEMLDRNKDGKVTLDEVPDQVRDRLKPLFDRLGKQELTQEEFMRATAFGRPDSGDMFARLDSNSDGKLTSDEVPERMRPMFVNLLRVAGKGADGSLTKDEFMKNFPGAMGRAGDDGRRPNPEQMPESARSREGRPEGMPAEGGMPLIFRLADTNRDGRLSKEEFAKVPELFAQLDRNQDGQLDLAELMGPRPGVDGRRLDGARGPARDGVRGDGEGVRRGDGDGAPRGDRDGVRRTDGDGARRGDAEGSRRGDGDGARRGDGDASRRGDGDGAPRGDRDGVRRADGDGARRGDNDRRVDGDGGRRVEGEGAQRGDREGARRTDDERTRSGDGDATFQRLDRDADGKISKDEAPDSIKNRFSEIDTNGDGFISRDELRSATPSQPRR